MKNTLKFILFDPNYNQKGHYENLKESIKSLFKENFLHAKNLSEIVIENKILNVIYCYTFKNHHYILQLLEKFGSEKNIKFIFNIWELKYENFLLEQQKIYKNIMIVYDGNMDYFKDKKYLCLNPPIIDYKKENILKKIPNIGEYVLAWHGDDGRYTNLNTINKLGEILQEKNINLLVISNNKIITEFKEELLEKNNNIYTFYGIIEDNNDYYSLCKNAKYCLVYTDKEKFYSFRSCSKISEFLYYDINFITNLNYEKLNNIKDTNPKIINKIEDLNNINFLNENTSNIKETSWCNNIFYDKILKLIKD